MSLDRLAIVVLTTLLMKCTTPVCMAAPACPDGPEAVIKLAGQPFPLDDGRWINEKGALVPQPAEASRASICVPYPSEDPATGKFGYRGQNNDWAISPSFNLARPFRYGRAVVRLNDGACTFLKLSGQEFAAHYRRCDDFEENATVVDLRGDSADSVLIDRDGRELMHNIARSLWDAAALPQPAHMSEGLIPLEDMRDGGGRFGFADATGAWAIKPTFSKAFEFHEGLAAVVRSFDESGKVGFINRVGHLVIPYRFLAVGRVPMFSNGLALVGDAGKSKARDASSTLLGFIDHHGRWVIPARFEEGREFDRNLAHVHEKGVEKYIDTSGRAIWITQ